MAIAIGLGCCKGLGVTRLSLIITWQRSVVDYSRVNVELSSLVSKLNYYNLLT